MPLEMLCSRVQLVTARVVAAEAARGTSATCALVADAAAGAGRRVLVMAHHGIIFIVHLHGALLLSGGELAVLLGGYLDNFGDFETEATALIASLWIVERKEKER